MTNPTHDQLDIVSIGMAEELQRSGREWKPLFGDHFVTSTPNSPYEEGHPRFLIGTVEQLEHVRLYPHGYLHLPRRRNLELALEKMGYDVFVESTLKKGGERVYHCCAYGAGQDDIWTDEVDTPADAVAMAWLEAKRRQAVE